VLEVEEGVIKKLLIALATMVALVLQVHKRGEGGGCHRRAARGREDGEGADHRLLRQDRGAESATRYLQRPQLRPHGVSAPGLSARPYFYRYSEEAIDLCDVFSSFSSQGKATLHEISRVMGLSGKPKGFDGSEMERYFRAGKIKEVADYCESDVVNTYQVWLRYELFRGTLSQEAFEASERRLADFMTRKASTIPTYRQLSPN
jgi:Predicted 3'-5' exonuclease related to the exonuclease domain of PolB